MINKTEISGYGVIDIAGDIITISVEDVGEFNLADILAELDGKYVRFNFTHVEKLNYDDFVGDSD